MTNDIINGIAVKLHEVFPNVTIYKENIHQGLEEPCFLILPLDSTQDAQLPNRYWRTYLFNVQYFPKSETEPKTEMLTVAETLFFELEHIFCLENPLRGIRMHYEIMDNVLHFFVSYNLFVKKQTKKGNFMYTLNYKQNTEE